MQKSAELVKDKDKEPLEVGITSKCEALKSNQQSKTSTSSSTEQDLDVFLLGGDSDEGPGTPYIIDSVLVVQYNGLCICLPVFSFKCMPVLYTLVCEINF